MNILLINPPQEGIYGKFRPPVQMHMGIAYLAAMVEDENVRVIDIDAEKISEGEFAAIVKEGSFDIAGFTVVTPTFHSSVKFAKVVKEHSPQTSVIFGGTHPTIMPYEVLGFDCVDIVVRGEGEITFKEIVGCIKRGGDLSKISGIVYREKEAICETPPRSLVHNLDELPFPARHLFKNKNYTFPDSLYKATAPIMTSRGCPGRCSFCASHEIWGRSFRPRSAKNIVDEIELLVKEKGIKEIHVWDDNFTTDKKRVFMIRDEIIRRGVKVKLAFPNGIRVDFLDREVLLALKEMGVYSLSIGVESGSQEVLNTCHKGIRLERIKEIFSLIKAMKFETWAFFMFGLPGDTIETIKQTIRLAKELDSDIAKFHILKPFPGNEIYAYLRSKNLILTHDYNKFGFHSPPIHRLEGLEPEDMIQWQKKAYRSFYFRPKKMLEQVLRIKTFNRFMLNLRAATGIMKMIF